MRRDFTEFNDKLYFTANDGSSGTELYVTDGTAEGTELVTDINPGSGSSYPGGFTEFNGKLYFNANDGSSGRELYVTDGTAEGTKLVADINPGSSGSGPYRFTEFTEFNDKLYFTANDGSLGDRLYATDGTAKGTKLVADINPSFGSGFVYSSVQGFAVLDDELFFSADNGSVGRELFKLTFDGTVTQALNPVTDTASDDNLVGTDSDDGITGNSNNNVLDGGAGNDVLDGGAGNDTLDGGAGTDTAVYQFSTGLVTVTLGEAETGGTASDGFGGTDSLFNLENVIGSDGNDSLTGNSGNNSLTGRDGNDVISGGEGDGFLTGSNGRDMLTGGEGSDRFVYLSFDEGGDTITDFTVGTDKIAVVSAGFFGGGLPVGELPESRFSLGSDATTSEQRFIFDDASGALFYDADGSGTAAPQLVTALTDSNLNAGDIMVL